MKTHIVKRSGTSPLKFVGVLIAESKGNTQSPSRIVARKLQAADNNPLRWHDISVYRTDGNKYVVCVNFHTRWKGETNFDEASVLANAEEVRTYLSSYDCWSYVQGWPPQPQFKERQERLRLDICTKFNEQVSDVLSAEEFMEIVQ